MYSELEINDSIIHSIKNVDLIWEHIYNNKKNLQFYWLGKHSFNTIWELQKALHLKRVNGEIFNVVLMLEHEHVYTFGKNADKNYLLNNSFDNIDIVDIDRGGEVTYHGPGQLVCYPIIDLHDYKMSISWYMRSLEEIIISYLQKVGINAVRKEKLTGVWVDNEKICAMGVRLAKWVTMHGFALNVNPNLSYFDKIIPCGIFEYGITSMHELGLSINTKVVAESIVDHFKGCFN